MRTKNAILNLITSFIAKIIVILYGLIIPKLIIVKYGSEVNGLITSISQFLAYITLLESGFGPVVTAALYKPIANKDNKIIANILKFSERFFRKISYIFLAYIVILSIIYPLIISSSFDYLFTMSLVIIIAISTFAEYYFGMAFRLYLQANQKTYIISIIQIITYLLSMSLMILFIKLNLGIHLVKAIGAIAFTLRPLLQNIYVKKKYNINLNESDSNFNLVNKWDGLAQHIASVIHRNTDVTLLTFFSTLKEVSVYSVYSLIVTGVKSLIVPISNSFEAGFGDMIAKGEIDNLNKKFKIYEILYYSIVVLIFSSALILIIPFIKLYTSGVTDTNYINYTFAVLIVLAEYVCCLRLPYISITYAGGYFKETRKGAWIEAFSNIIISLLLIKKYNLIGVAIGTLFAMTYRAIEFMIFSSKVILKRPYWHFIKMILYVVFLTTIIIFINNYISFKVYNYFDWIKYATITVSISSLIIIIFDLIFFKKYIIHLKKYIHLIGRRKKF